MTALQTIGLLIISNIFMTFAWYGHVKLQEQQIITSNTPLIVIILLSWLLALAEYACQVPANRYGFVGNGGTFSLLQLKIIQEVITLVVFSIFTLFFFNDESIRWNHIAAFGCLVLAVYFAFLK
ncbi:MAG: DMT family protein [Bacteroidaceae bacterium]|nr:DMT family protein [Bacteroidaceae bacterium]